MGAKSRRVKHSQHRQKALRRDRGSLWSLRSVSLSPKEAFQDLGFAAEKRVQRQQGRTARASQFSRVNADNARLPGDNLQGTQTQVTCPNSPATPLAPR